MESSRQFLKESEGSLSEQELLPTQKQWNIEAQAQHSPQSAYYYKTGVQFTAANALVNYNCMIQEN